ncbi:MULTISPECIES: ABC transporter ATP-binding protein [unclassified Rathayibacter]|uniref:ABC transporter ATP-binding protein n=1 Tax=unclassified Rathayibacter TaxID=2609250 RepID=UPI00188B4302|nr:MULTISPECIES: ABC transporter ATP-binding protein [unclassified Rathayibacter]MBF4463115.1 ABC transporter ATP-binding protein [Rathayibacter sp. VKM Ac-2879]MBF4504648.1 ABC transporter ATP-binding protein [Rathayibacter sp. VKM Ac-2878]
MDGTTPTDSPRGASEQAPPAAAPAWAAPDATGRQGEIALRIRGLRKRFGDKEAVKSIDLDVPAGSFFGLVGPNGAGKTTTLSMATALLRPDDGVVTIHDVDVWKDTLEAKRLIGVLADGVKLFDRLTGLQLITYYGLLCDLPRPTVVERANDLLALLGLDPADRTLVVDYSAGMTKKIALACALVRAPRLLVLDEPFESVDPVSAANIRDILVGFVASGGTVIVSSHSMDLVERMCDRVAVIADGRVLASGTLDEVRAGSTLEERFVEMVGGRTHQEGPAWLRIS